MTNLFAELPPKLATELFKTLPSPKDVGGERDYSEVIADHKHDRHREFKNWNGPDDPEAFDAAGIAGLEFGK